MVSFASGISRTFKDELKIDVSKAAWSLVTNFAFLFDAGLAKV